MQNELSWKTRVRDRRLKAVRQAFARAAIVASLCQSAPIAARADEAISFDEHVKPILRESCWGCHKVGSAKSGLALDSFAGVIEGGASGDVVASGDLDGSRLWQLVSHQDQPVMPPDGGKLSDDKLAVIKAWIEGGLLDKPGGARQQKATGLEAMEVKQLAPGEIGPMPQGLFAQPVVVAPRAGAISSLAASPTAPVLAVTGQRQIMLYHTIERRLLGVLPFADGAPLSVRFTTNGDWLIVAGGQAAYSGRVSVYDVATGKWLTDLGEDSDVWLAADISPDRQFVAAGGPTKVVHVMSTGSGESIAILKRHTDWIQATAYSSNGNYLATGDRNGGIWLWETPAHRELLSCNGHKAAITALDWRPDGKILASASEDGTLRLWSPQNGKEVKKWEAHKGGALSVRWTRDGNLVSVGRDHHLKLWDAAGKLTTDFGALTDVAMCCAATYDGSAFTGADWQGQLQFFEAATGDTWALTSNPPTLQSIVAECQRRVTDATASLETANREMELVATTRQELQAKYDDMLKEVVETGGEELPATAPDDEVLRRIGELTVERERLEKREPVARQAVVNAEKALQEAQAGRQQAEAELKRFTDQEVTLANAVTQAHDLVVGLELRLSQHEQYAAELRTMIDAAAAAQAISDKLESSNIAENPINQVRGSVTELAKIAAEKIATVNQELNEARASEQRSAKRLQLFQLRVRD